MQGKYFKRFSVLLASVATAAFMLGGCSDGKDGATGAQGEPGEPGQDSAAAATTVVKLPTTGISVTVPSPAGVQGALVKFKVTDAADNAVTTLPTGTAVTFTFAKLERDANGYTKWTSYINREGAITNNDNVGSDPDGKPAIKTPVLQATTQAAGAIGGATPSTLVNLGGGEYSYAFTAAGVTTTNFATPIAFDATATNRVGIQIQNGGLKAANIVYDFVPAGGTPTVTRNIVTTEACLECHGTRDLFGFHNSSARKEVEYCVTCHNPGSIDPNSGNTVDMANMIHKIHAGKDLPSVQAGGSYIIWGNQGSKHDYSEVGYPQDLRNCTKCHTASTVTPDGDNWKTRPSRNACGACHDNVNFVTGAGHSLSNLAQSNDNACVICHDAATVTAYHVTPYSTPLNPTVKPGLATITYELPSVTVNASNQAVFKFRIKKDGTTVTALPIAGFTGGPNFYVASSIPQDGLTAPADFNTGNNAGLFGPEVGTSAPNVSLATVLDGTRGTLGAADADGFFTATIIYPNAIVPTGAKQVTGVMMGSFSQTNAEVATGKDLNNDGDKVDAYNILAKAQTKVATGFTGRRQIITDAKCNACHDQLGTVPSFHGGARSDASNCSICHNPVRNSSSWSSNYRDIAHSIHAGGMRTNQYGWHADLQYWKVKLPNAALKGERNCEACHLPGTYDYSAAVYTTALLGQLLPSTASSSNVAALAATAAPWLSIGNYSDIAATATTALDKSANLVISPITASCLGCHDKPAAVAHMKQNGASIYAPRTLSVLGMVQGESCLTCHGPGRSVNIKDAHAIK